MPMDAQTISMLMNAVHPESKTGQAIQQMISQRNPATSQGGNNLIANMQAASQGRGPVTPFGRSVPGQGEPTAGFGAIPPMFSGGDKGFYPQTPGNAGFAHLVGAGGGGGGGGDLAAAIMRRIISGQGGATSRVDPYNPMGAGSQYRSEDSINDDAGVMPPGASEREMLQAQQGRQTSNSPVPPAALKQYIQSMLMNQMGKLPMGMGGNPRGLQDYTSRATFPPEDNMPTSAGPGPLLAQAIQRQLASRVPAFMGGGR